MADILDKDFKTTVLKMLKKTKEVEKSQENDTWTKWRYQWKVESLKRNPGAEKYNNWNLKLARKAQHKKLSVKLKIISIDYPI